MKKITIIVMIWLGAAAAVLGQGKNGETQRFNYDIIAFPDIATGSSLVDVYLWLNNAQLQFLRTDSVYTARYQINLAIYSSTKIALLTRDSSYTTTVDNYAATINQENRKVHRFRFRLPPNNYEFYLRVKDLNSGRSMSEKVAKEIVPFQREKIFISDVLLLSVQDSISIDKNDVIPSQHVPMGSNLFIYAQVYVKKPGERITIRAVQKYQRRLLLHEKVVAADSSLIPIVFVYPKDKMVRGACQLALEAESDRFHSETTRPVVFYGNINVLTSASLDEMIDQLKYIAPGKEWEKMKKAAGTEKLRLFQQFWKQRDALPDTPENELFDEYYARVRETNEKFSHGEIAGWQTQRGHVYLLHGTPDRVEQNNDPYNASGIYEIWYYHDLNKKFVFYDEYGFGDYKLVSGRIE